MTTCIVVLGGDRPDQRVRSYLPIEATVIAADSGVDHALHLGLGIDLAVGDFDSVSLAGLAHLQHEHVSTERYSVDKDASDGELALGAACDSGATDITVVCGGGVDRLDHLLVTAMMLTAPYLAGVAVTAWIGSAHVAVVRAGTPAHWSATRGEIVTVLAVNGAANGVSTNGLQWHLEDEDLQPGSSRGLSNIATSQRCSVSVRDGVLLVIRPDIVTA